MALYVQHKKLDFFACLSCVVFAIMVAAFHVIYSIHSAVKGKNDLVWACGIVGFFVTTAALYLVKIFREYIKSGYFTR